MTEKPTHAELEGSLPKVKRPIARVVSQRLAVLVAIVTILASVANYFYSMASTKELVCEQLMKYNHERGLRESVLFLESDAYQARFQKEYVERYKRMGNEDPTEWFDAHLEKRSEDGTYRSKPELYYGIDRGLGRRDHSASMMIGRDTKITPEVLRALAIGYDMINQYGPAWRKPFVDLYFSSPEKTSVSRWPGTPWGLMIDDAVEWREEEWMAITMKEQNPEREQRWSGVLYDERNGNWMVSGVTPLDIDGKQVGMVGTDLLLDDLIKRTVNENLSGSYNILLQTDGRIIAHPDMVKKIIAGKGQLSAQNAEDNHLLDIYEKVRNVTTFPAVINNDKGNEFLAVTRIAGPDWYFITVYPKSLLRDKALRSAGFTLLSGFGSLSIMILLILFVLKRNLTYPLGQLTQTIRDFEIGRGQGLDRTDASVKNAVDLSTRQDETGLLARSFVKMKNNLRTTYAELDERKEALRKSDTKHKEMIANISDVIAILNIDGTIKYKSPNIEKWFGWRPEDLVGTDGWETVHPEDLERVQKEFFMLLKQDNSTRTVEYRYKCKDESYKMIELTAVNLTKDPIVNGVLMNYHDITERRQAEEALRESEEKLARSNKMEAMGLMAGGVAHDLNNILSGILSYPELLLMDLPEDSPLRKPINTIRESGMRAADVVGDLLTIARGVATGREVLNLNTLVTEYLGSAEYQELEKTRSFVSCRTELAPDLLNMSGSPSHIKKILMNLITNASEAIEGSGTVTISTANRYLDEPLIGYEDVRSDEYVLLTVSDDGSGISPEDLERIFEPFYTKKIMGKSGTGLGLAVVWNTVQDHSGYININTSEKGTAFELYFPVTREEVADEGEEVPLEDYIGHGEKILVVDDEERQREIASGILTRLGYNAETVSSGEEAIEYVKEKPVDLIVLDMVMPKGINGRKTYEEIIKIRPDQKAIIASGYTKTKEVDIAQKLGAGKYIKKPYTLEKIGVAVKKGLEI